MISRGFRVQGDTLVPMVLDLFEIEGFPVPPHDIVEVTQKLDNFPKVNLAAQVKMSKK